MKLKLALVVGFVAVLFSAKTALASEGEFELRNRVGDSARCWAASVLMENNRYDIIMSCRDILYPGGTEVFSYVVWAIPSDGGNHIKLGTVDLGKVQFQAREAFSTLYVTKEPDAKVRTPSGTIVMQGGHQRIELLDGQAVAPVDNDELSSSPTPNPVVSAAPRNLGRIFAAGGILAFIAIFGVILVIFVVTRK